MKIFIISILCIISAGAVAMRLDPGLKNELVSDFCSAPHPATVYVPEVTPSAPVFVAVAPKVAPPIEAWQAPSPIPARDHWTWIVGANTYADVSIVKIEPDVVTIMHSTGGGEVEISELSPDMQAALNYDPAAAAVAHVDRMRIEAASRVALRQEGIEAQNQVMAMQAQSDATKAAHEAMAAQQQAAIGSILAQIASLRAQADQIEGSARGAWDHGGYVQQYNGGQAVLNAPGHATNFATPQAATDLRRQADKLAASLSTN